MKNFLGKMACQAVIAVSCSYGASVTALQAVSELLPRELNKLRVNATVGGRPIWVDPLGPAPTDYNGLSLVFAKTALTEQLKRFITSSHTEFMDELNRKVPQLLSLSERNQLFLNLFLCSHWTRPCTFDKIYEVINTIGRDCGCIHYWADDFQDVTRDIEIFVTTTPLIQILDKFREHAPLLRRRANIESLWIAEVPDEADTELIRAEIMNTLEAIMDIADSSLSRISKENAQSICTYLRAILEAADDKVAIKAKVAETLDTCLIVMLGYIDDILRDVRAIRSVFFQNFPGVAEFAPQSFASLDDRLLQRIYCIVQDYQEITPEIRPVMLMILQELLKLDARLLPAYVREVISNSLSSFKNIGIQLVRSKTRGVDHVFYAEDPTDSRAIRETAREFIMNYNVTSMNPDLEPVADGVEPGLVESISNLCFAPLFQQVRDFHYAYTKAARFNLLPFFYREVWPQKKHCNGSLGALFADFTEKLFAFKEAKKIPEFDYDAPELVDLGPFSRASTTSIAHYMLRQALGTIVGNNPNIFPETIAKNIYYWRLAELFFEVQDSKYRPLLRRHKRTIEALMNRLETNSLYTILLQASQNIPPGFLGNHQIYISLHGLPPSPHLILMDSLILPAWDALQAYLAGHKSRLEDFVTNGYKTHRGPILGSSLVEATDTSREFIFHPQRSPQIQLQDIIFVIPLLDSLEIDGVEWYFTDEPHGDWTARVGFDVMLRKYFLGTILPTLT